MLRFQHLRKFTQIHRGLHVQRDTQENSVEIWSLQKPYINSEYLKTVNHQIKNTRTDESIKTVVI